MIDVRVRSRLSETDLAERTGKILTDDDYDLLLTGPGKVQMPNGAPLCVYLPGVLAEAMDAPGIYDVLHSLRTSVTDNRGAASGSQRLNHGDKRTRSKRVASTMIGTFDPKGGKKFCRLSSWTSANLPKYRSLEPLFQAIDAHFFVNAPARYAAQKAEIDRCDANWYIPGTVFTTITVNNTYPTGVHKDAGDLESGFSTLAVLRRGNYTGGLLVFPEFRVGVDMQHGDLLLMDAHQWHGNTRLMTEFADESLGIPEAERISVVSYMRTGVVDCGSAEQEYERAAWYAEKGGTR